MNWKAESIQRLKEYEQRKQALILIPEQIRALEMNFTSIRAARSDAEPVKDGDGNKRENALINNIMKRQELEKSLEVAKMEIEITERAYETLTNEEKEVLSKFYINRTRGYLDELCEILNSEKSRIYEIKDTALRKFTLACCGTIDI